MDQTGSTINSVSPTGRERRAHTRHPISVPVEIKFAGLEKHSGEARDYCPGGLLIAFPPDCLLPADKSLEMSLCLITLKIDGDDFRMRAQVVRADQDSLGVSFMNPDQIALKALQKHSELNVQPVRQNNCITNENVAQEQFNSRQLNEILNNCNSIIKGHLQPLLDNFVMLAVENLLNSVKDENDIGIENMMFKAVETITKNKNFIITTFISEIETSLEGIQTLKKDDISEFYDENTASSLQLISDEEFNIWLANSKIINNIESEYSQLLSGIEHRLGYLYGEYVDRRNNPYGPALFANSFQNMLETMEFDDRIKPVCYDAFRTAVVSISESLYKEMNQVLIDNDILPNLKDIVSYARKSERSIVDKDKITTDNISQKNDSVNTGDDKAILTESEKIKSDNKISQQSLYELVGEIRNLQHQIKVTSSSSIASTSLPKLEGERYSIQESVNNQSDFYSTEEVLDVIGNIVTPAKVVTGDGKSLEEFRNKLNEKLTRKDGDSSAKTLSVQQGRIIDVTENVFKSLLNDMQVAHSVRPWLENLTAPIMKMALLDEKIFTDKNHVVRDVINKLAELEVLASAEDKEEQAAVKQAFNWIINLVNKEFDGTTQVFLRAVQQLDILINVQQQSFEKNIKEVVAEAIKEERENTNEKSSVDSIDEVEEEHDKWFRMVSRLKENHWVLFDDDSDNYKRLKVAWIAPRKGKLVFVNVMGRKDKITTNLELADMFRSGKAMVLDGTDNPAMDRAQYSMLQKLHQQLLFQSSHDELTGLINRREFINCIQHAVDDAKQSKSKHAVCYIDIDNFKVINTSYGYDAGDKLLKEVVGLINTHIEEQNALSRIGADQFALLLQKTSMDDAVELIEDIMDKFIDYRFEWQDNRMAVTLCTGIAIVTANSDDAASLFQTAESSCIIAKESGGNQIQIAHIGSNRLSRRKKDMEWATKIDKALDEDALFLRCQKIAPTQPHLDQRSHYEILLGISDELGGNKSLGDFIQAAEHHNRMVAVDRWVIKNAFQWLAKYEDMVTDVSAFSINLSGQSLNNEQLIEFIYQQENKTSVPIEKICFEVTETAGVTNLSDTADFIQTIKATGCKFALDDFGTGMSSYSYLKSLPVDYLKIDGVFIKDIVNNRNDYAVVKSICEIGHFMEKKVIAEFVQDDESIEILKGIGVDYLQGYGIDRPHKLDELIR